MTDDTGFGIIPRYVRGKLTAIEIAVFVALTWRVDSHGMCWPSHGTIAKEAGTSVKSVKRALDSLRVKGLVDWVARTSSKHGGPTSNLYRLAIWQRASLEAEGVGHTDLGGRSQWPTNDTQGTTPIAPSEDQDSVSIPRPTSSGPRDRGTNVFDAEGLIAEIDNDMDATGWLASNWGNGADGLVEAAWAELQTNSAIKNKGAWLTAALANQTTAVGKATRLLKIVGDDYDE